MAHHSFGPPGDFTDLVRDALLHLYEPAYLQGHPLLALLPASRPARLPAALQGRSLRQAIHDAIEALHPEAGTPVSSRAWRTYRILELRYIEGQDSASTAEQAALSKAQYHREHHQALLAVATLVWDRWEVAGRWPPSESGAEQGVTVAGDDLTRHEADALLTMGGQGSIDLVEVCHGVGRMLAPLYRRQAASLELHLPDDLPPVAGERVTLRQALLGILAHAIDRVDDAVIEVTGGRQGSRVELCISGPTRCPVAGVMAGLVESRPFIVRAQGQVVYVPAPGPSARWNVYLSLPVSEQRTMLVVDNSADFIRLIERYLDGLGWEVIGTGDVSRASVLARQHGPQVIMLDIVLPTRDGWELLEELKALPATRAIPVLVCSVLDEPAVALSLGAAAYLHKPVDRSQLLDALAALEPAGRVLTPQAPVVTPPSRAVG